MIVTTTPAIEGHRITAYHGVVVGEAIMGANIVRDLFASVRDVVGGRAGSYEAKLQDAREIAFSELEERARALGGNAVVGVDLDYEVVGDTMLMVSASGTAVETKPEPISSAPVPPAPAASPQKRAPADDQVQEGAATYSNVDITLCEIDKKQVVFATDMEKDPIQRSHRKGNFYEVRELNALRTLVKPNGVVVDIGANIGNHSLYAALFLDAEKIIPVEPNPRAYRLLQLNMALNQVSDRFVYDYLGVGLGDTAATGFGVERRESNLGAAKLIFGQGDVEVMTGDEILAGETPNFIKLDVEGMEMAALAGLRKTIERCRPILLIEVDEKNYDAFEALMAELRYDVFDVVQRYKTNKNYLLIPGAEVLAAGT